MGKKKNGKVEVVVVLDRSGSMAAVATDTIGGFNTFLAGARTGDGKSWISLVQFDHVREVVYEGEKAADAPELTAETFVPRGQTALRDAVVFGGALLKQRMSAKPKRLGQLVILTDGQENASTEVPIGADATTIKGLRDQEVLVQFIGAGESAAVVGKAMGVDPALVAGHKVGDGAAMRASFAAVTRGSMAFRGSGGNLRSAAYLDSERTAMSDGSD